MYLEVIVIHVTTPWPEARVVDVRGGCCAMFGEEGRIGDSSKCSSQGINSR